MLQIKDLDRELDHENLADIRGGGEPVLENRLTPQNSQPILELSPQNGLTSEPILQLSPQNNMTENQPFTPH